MLERPPTFYDDKIYGADWRAWTDPEVPEEITPTTLLLDRHLGTPIAEKAAVIVDGDSTSYAELAKLVHQISTGLIAFGVEREDRVLMFGTDSLDYAAMWLAVVRIGAVPAAVSDLYKARELLYFLRDTAARALYIDAEQGGKLNEIAGELPTSLCTVILRSQTPPDILPKVPRVLVLPFHAIKNQGIPSNNRPYPRHPNDVAYMFYSGGTTGTAKGITHLAHDFILVPERHGRFWDYRAGDVVFATSKKYFTHGLWPGLLIPLYWGATAVLIRSPPRPDAVLETLAQARATKLITVPTVLKNMLEHLGRTGLKPHLPALEFAASASEKIPPEIFSAFHARFGVELFDSIGSSEITYEWIANRAREFRRGSLGKPVFGCEVRLVTPEGDVSKPNVPGEAWIRSRTACFYYWRKFDKSRATFIGEWTRTGDNLYFDEDGFFWFSGRGDDMFKVRGLWVTPLEIEAALTAHPAVREAAAVSFVDRNGLTKPMAYVVLRDGFVPGDALAIALCAAVRPLGGYKVPERFAFIDELPRTTLLKIDRRALRGRQRSDLEIEILSGG